MGNTFWRERESIEGDYEVKEVLGRGAFSSVKRCINKQTKKEFAVKVIKKKHLDPKTLQNVKDEVDILHKIDHPNVVHLDAVYDTPDKLYIVLEL
jgi:serine/threonine protein kinase